MTQETKIDRRQMLGTTAGLAALPLLPALSLEQRAAAPKMPEYPDLENDGIVVTFDASCELTVGKMLVMEQIYKLGSFIPMLILFEYRDLDCPPENRFLTLENAMLAYTSIKGCYQNNVVDYAQPDSLRVPVGMIYDRANFQEASVEYERQKPSIFLYESLFEEHLCRSHLAGRGTDSITDGQHHHLLGLADARPMERFAFAYLGTSQSFSPLSRKP